MLDINDRHTVHMIQGELKVAVGAHNLDGKIWSFFWTKDLPTLAILYPKVIDPVLYVMLHVSITT